MNVKNDDVVGEVVLRELFEHNHAFNPKLRLQLLHEQSREGPLLPFRDPLLVNPVNLTTDQRIDDNLPTGPRPVIRKAPRRGAHNR
eukprot:3004433-Rhodomonas_salina.1